MPRPSIAPLLLLFGLLIGCGSDEPAPVQEAPAASDPTSGTAEPVEEAPSEPVKSIEASCDLSGSKPAHVTLLDDGASLTATFTGQPVAPTGPTGFYISVYDATGTGGQMGAKFMDGEPIDYFINVEDEGPQTTVTGEPDVAGSTIKLTFPKELGGLDGIGIAKWNATYTLDGEDVGMCPPGYETLPFPSEAE
jgi:hypothetical protein